MTDAIAFLIIVFCIISPLLWKFTKSLREVTVSVEELKEHIEQEESAAQAVLRRRLRSARRYHRLSPTEPVASTTSEHVDVMFSPHDVDGVTKIFYHLRIRDQTCRINEDDYEEVVSSLEAVRAYLKALEEG